MRRVLIFVLLTAMCAAQQQIPSSFFGFTQNKTASSNFPAWGSFGSIRFWDSPPCQWPSINTASGVFNFSQCLDVLLQTARSNGVFVGLYDLWRTPPWASSNPTDTTHCHDNGTSNGQGPGECYPPNDLNADGSGTNAIWKAWVTAIATHVNDPNYLNGTGSWAAHGANCASSTPCPHAHISYWEPVNEPDESCGGSNQCFYFGSLAQLARLTEDTRCIILGSQGGKNVIHDKGNGTATPCTATPIDPSASILMSPTHAMGQAVTYTQNELYCSATSHAPSYQLPCPNPKNATAAAIDVVIVHMKPGNETGNNCPAPTPCTIESAMAMYAKNIRAVLQPRELGLPFWDGEASYSPTGFVDPYTSANPGNQASFFPRFYMTLWSLGISLSAFYTSDSISSQSGSVGQNSTNQAAQWLAGSTLSPCTSSGTVWSCNFTDEFNVAHLAMYDTSKLCTGSTCPTQTQTIASNWTTYQDMTAASTPSAIGSHAVPVGIKPIVITGSAVLAPLPPSNLKGNVK